MPSRQALLDFLRDHPGKAGLREIMRAFALEPAQRGEVRSLLHEMAGDGLIERGHKRRLAAARLPSVTVVEVTGLDADGEVLARPLSWKGKGAPPVIYMAPEPRGRAALGAGERVLARLRRLGEGTYEGRTMRRITPAPATVLGVYEKTPRGGRIRPVDRRVRDDMAIAPEDAGGARPGDLVRAEALPARHLGLRQARVVERLEKGPRSASQIAIHEREIPTEFTAGALAQARAAGAAPAKGREDLRTLPLVTIDGADARDFDDAVWAEADPDPENPGGWHLIVAIADVAWYVRPGDALDQGARERGNSAYFPDRVVPMLPEELSNGWCSLNPKEDRPCLAAHLWLDAEGALRRHRFRRAVIHSAARLTYEQVQKARDGQPDSVTAPLMDRVIAPLYGAFEALSAARAQRGVLELDLPERRVVIDAEGTVAGIETRARFDSHKLIEEFMIAANVAAAQTLQSGHRPTLYRVHDAPTADKLEAFRTTMNDMGLRFPRGGAVTSAHFNGVLARVAGTPEAPLVNDLVLRSQAQAAYAPRNIGHFGLALRQYCHFTSPIRRYADLVVHRGLIESLSLGEGGRVSTPEELAELGEHLSMTERRADAAERDAVDRFTALWLADHAGAQFAARINGVTRFGLFVTLTDSGADGLVPKRSLPADSYHHDEARHLLRGRHTNREYRLGDAVEVRLAEVNTLTGGLVFHLMDGGGPARPAKRTAPGKGKGKKPAKAAKRTKKARKAKKAKKREG